MFNFRKAWWLYALLIAVPIGTRFLLDAVGGSAWENSAIRAMLVPLADSFLNTFNNPAIALVLSFLILLLAVIFAIFFLLFKVRPALRVLGALRADLARIADPRGSHEALAAVDAILSRGNPFEADWRAARDRMAGTTALPARAESILPLRALDQSGMSFAFFRYLQDLFVGAGLVLTFCGLVAGLYFASKGVMSAELTEAKDGLVKLLQSSTFKFMTSIAGVSASLLLGLVYRIAIDQITRSHRATAGALEGVLPTGSTGNGVTPGPTT